MKRRIYIWAAAVVMALALTACGDGSGVVINGTTGAQEEKTGDTDSSATETPASQNEETTAQAGGTKINIITGETVAEETQSSPEETQPEPTEAPTTAAPTTAASTTAAPATTAPTTTAAPETTAAREYEVRELSKTMYAKSSVRVRAGYSTSTEILGALSEGESVQITGESDNGWMRVTWKGLTGFVSKSYLSDDPPATTAAATENRPTATQTGGTTPGTTTTPGGTTPAPGGTETTPGGNEQGPSAGGQTPAPGTDTQPGAGGASISGTVLQFDPTGVTIQASNGSSYTFSWGSASIPADLQPGNSVQITYEGSTIVTISK